MPHANAEARLIYGRRHRDARQELLQRAGVEVADAEGADTVVWMAQSNQATLSTGKLFLDREPRSTYLLGNNVESEEERKALEPRLQHDFESALANTA